jgi:hypothetical protein
MVVATAPAKSPAVPAAPAQGSQRGSGDIGASDGIAVVAVVGAEG